MKLPLVDEIRDARHLSEEAHRADQDCQLIQLTLDTLRIWEQAVGNYADAPDLPGNELIERLAESWTQLADLPSAGPRPSMANNMRVSMRRQQLQAARQLLSPIAERAPAFAASLSQLQHEQQHLLDNPAFVDAVAELNELSRRRERTARKLGPIKERLAAFKPATLALLKSQEVLVETAASGTSVPGLQVWRTALVANTVVATTWSMLATTGLKVPAPPQIDLPEAPDPTLDDSLRAAVQQIATALSNLEAHIERAQAETAAEAEAIELEFEAVTQQILARMG